MNISDGAWDAVWPIFVSFSQVITFLSLYISPVWPLACTLLGLPVEFEGSNQAYIIKAAHCSLLDRHVGIQSRLPPSGRNSCGIKDLEWKLWKWTSFSNFLLLNLRLCTWNNLKAFINIWWNGESPRYVDLWKLQMLHLSLNILSPYSLAKSNCVS